MRVLAVLALLPGLALAQPVRLPGATVGAWGNALAPVLGHLAAAGAPGAEPIARLAALDLGSPEASLALAPLVRRLEAAGHTPEQLKTAEHLDALKALAFAADGAAQDVRARLETLQALVSDQDAGLGRLLPARAEAAEAAALAAIYLKPEEQARAQAAPAALETKVAALQQRVLDAFAGGKDGLPDAAVRAAAAPQAREDRESKGIRLGLLGSAQAVDGRRFALNEWQFVSFSVETPAKEGLGEFQVGGPEDPDHDLVVRHGVREVPGRPGLYRHEYSALALGSTPEGLYQVALGPVRFSVEVAKKSRETRAQAAASMARIVTDVFSRETPPLPFAEGVAPEVRGFLRNHRDHWADVLDAHDAYAAADDLLSPAEREAALARTAAVRAAYEAVIAGKGAHPHLAGLIPALHALEAPVLEAYKGYLEADPSQSPYFVESHVESLDHYIEIERKLREVAADGGFDEPESALVRWSGRVYGGWQAFKLRVRLWAAGMGAVLKAWTGRLAAAPAEKEPGLPFGAEVPEEVRSFLTAVDGFVRLIGPQVKAYLEADAGLDPGLRAEKLARIEAARTFLDKRIAGEGFRYTIPSIATSLLYGGARDLAADFAAYLQSDESLDEGSIRIRTRSAEEYVRLLESGRDMYKESE